MSGEKLLYYPFPTYLYGFFSAIDGSFSVISKNAESTISRKSIIDVYNQNPNELAPLHFITVYNSGLPTHH